MAQPAAPVDVGLSWSEIRHLIKNWISVDGGYRVSFAYGAHNDFRLVICDIDVDMAV